MLLIFFFGLIANSAMFCNGCDFGTTGMSNFDWSKFAGVWYLKSHYNNSFEDQYDCVTCTIEPPSLGTSRVFFSGYINSTQFRPVDPAIASNWNSTGYFYLASVLPIWTGQHYVISTDYDSYAILKHCPVTSNQVTVYVWYRTPHPDAATVQVVKNELQEYNINGTQLEDFPNTYC